MILSWNGIRDTGHTHHHISSFPFPLSCRASAPLGFEEGSKSNQPEKNLETTFYTIPLASVLPREGKEQSPKQKRVTAKIRKMLQVGKYIKLKVGCLGGEIS